ncbi:MAG: hypothetical protein N3B01_05885, partial [Verrucomicrobiae bacterium]|nr:hypothetical protein [Verrucomicrobiae bacterium]
MNSWSRLRKSRYHRTTTRLLLLKLLGSNIRRISQKRNDRSILGKRIERNPFCNEVGWPIAGRIVRQNVTFTVDTPPWVPVK